MTYVAHNPCQLILLLIYTYWLASSCLWEHVLFEGNKYPLSMCWMWMFLSNNYSPFKRQPQKMVKHWVKHSYTKTCSCSCIYSVIPPQTFLFFKLQFPIQALSFPAISSEKRGEFVCYPKLYQNKEYRNSKKNPET